MADPGVADAKVEENDDDVSLPDSCEGLTDDEVSLAWSSPPSSRDASPAPGAGDQSACRGDVGGDNDNGNDDTGGGGAITAAGDNPAVPDEETEVSSTPVTSSSTEAETSATISDTAVDTPLGRYIQELGKQAQATTELTAAFRVKAAAAVEEGAAAIAYSESVINRATNGPSALSPKPISPTPAKAAEELDVATALGCLSSSSSTGAVDGSSSGDIEQALPGLRGAFKTADSPQKKKPDSAPSVRKHTDADAGTRTKVVETNRERPPSVSPPKTDKELIKRTITDALLSTSSGNTHYDAARLKLYDLVELVGTSNRNGHLSPREFMVFMYQLVVCFAKSKDRSTKSLKAADELLTELKEFCAKHEGGATTSHFLLLYIARAELRAAWNDFDGVKAAFEEGSKVLSTIGDLEKEGTSFTVVPIEPSTSDAFKGHFLAILNETEKRVSPSEELFRCKFADCDYRRSVVYNSDVDVTPFTVADCTGGCHLSYHDRCWKEWLKSRHLTKDWRKVLSSSCPTPDCNGQISGVTIRDELNVIKDQQKLTVPCVGGAAGGGDAHAVNENATAAVAKSKNQRKREQLLQKKQQRQQTASRNRHQTAPTGGTNNDDDKKSEPDADTDSRRNSDLPPPNLQTQPMHHWDDEDELDTKYKINDGNTATKKGKKSKAPKHTNIIVNDGPSIRARSAVSADQVFQGPSSPVPFDGLSVVPTLFGHSGMQDERDGSESVDSQNEASLRSSASGVAGVVSLKGLATELRSASNATADDNYSYGDWEDQNSEVVEGDAEEEVEKLRNQLQVEKNRHKGELERERAERQQLEDEYKRVVKERDHVLKDKEVETKRLKKRFDEQQKEIERGNLSKSAREMELEASLQELGTSLVGLQEINNSLERDMTGMVDGRTYDAAVKRAITAEQSFLDESYKRMSYNMEPMIEEATSLAKHAREVFQRLLAERGIGDQFTHRWGVYLKNCYEITRNAQQNFQNCQSLKEQIEARKQAIAIGECTLDTMPPIQLLAPAPAKLPFPELPPPITSTSVPTPSTYEERGGPPPMVAPTAPLPPFRMTPITSPSAPTPPTYEESGGLPPPPMVPPTATLPPFRMTPVTSTLPPPPTEPPSLPPPLINAGRGMLPPPPSFENHLKLLDSGSQMKPPLVRPVASIAASSQSSGNSEATMIQRQTGSKGEALLNHIRLELPDFTTEMLKTWFGKLQATENWKEHPDRKPKIMVEIGRRIIDLYKRELRMEKQIQEDVCCICHSNLSDGGTIVACPKCHYNIHRRCVSSWLHTKSLCPICNQQWLLDDEYPELGVN